MTKLVETSDATHDEIIFQCDCHDWHYLRMVWDHEDPDWRMLWLEYMQRPTGLQRIKTAWRALLGKDIHHGEIILKPDVAKAIHDYLEIWLYEK